MNIPPPQWLVAGLAIAFSVCSFAADPAPAPAPSKPNIIFILSDDVGLGNISSYGGAFKTPNIDSLAAGGTRFELSYALPVCGPSRCEFLTGRYAFRTGLVNNHVQEAVQPGREVMIQAVLKKAGYATACVGKWGQMSHGPVEWGFDESLYFPGSGRYWREQTPFYTVNGKRVNLPEGKYLPDIMHEYVVEFIERHKDGPFFLYYPMSEMHAPIVHTPENPSAGRDFYADNNDRMDKLVGRLMGELDRLKLREKTVVIFSGDNGTAKPNNAPNAARSTAGGCSAPRGTCSRAAAANR